MISMKSTNRCRCNINRNGLAESTVFKLNGKLHRVDGPAIEQHKTKGGRFWFINDCLISSIRSEDLKNLLQNS